MQSRSKVVELNGKKFELRRLPPEEGSFIFMRILGVSMKMRSDIPTPKTEEAAGSADLPKATGEMQVKALAFAVFSGGMGFSDFKFIQNACMRVVSLHNEAGLPMPVMTDDGTWTADGKDLADDVGMVMKLTSEVLVFCFADFFEGGGLGSLT